jgi:tRNA (guanine-N7-)-methyltransferase
MRLRQHTNPLTYRGSYQGPPPTELLGGAPTELEIGPGYGELLVARGREAPAIRLLGIEVRRAYVDLCQQALAAAGVRNACAIYAEARVDVPRLIADGSLDRIYLMFPDPWFKRRHHKRRVLDAGFAAVLAVKLRPGGELHYATDNAELGIELRAILDAVGALQRVGDRSPAIEQSGRGQHHLGRGDAIASGRYARRSQVASSDRA